MIAALPIATFPLLLIAAAIKDAVSMTIPNWISLGLVGGFAVVAPFVMSPADLGVHLLVGLGALAAGFSLFAVNRIGGGDAKLFAAAALWLGWAALPEFLFWMAIIGGLFCLVLLAARKAAFMLPVAFGDGPLGRLLDPKGDVPYGVALAAGGLIAFPQSQIFFLTIGAGG